MSNFPKLLSSQYAYDMAQVILDGFVKHYRIFREASFNAKKDFGLTWHGRVVFYDYDEIEYFTDCNIKNIPQALTKEEMSGETWYHVGPKDIFPELYGTFLLGDTRVRRSLMKHHTDFFDPQTWRNFQNLLKDARTPDHFGYPEQLQFVNRYPSK